MKSSNTFGVHFTLRTRELNGKNPLYARITVNKTRCELSLKYNLDKNDWNERKRRGIAKLKNEELKQLNSYLEEIRGKLARHYRELLMQGKEVTAESGHPLDHLSRVKNPTRLWRAIQSGDFLS